MRFRIDEKVRERYPQVEAGWLVAEIFPKMAGSGLAETRFVEPSAERLAESGATTAFLALPHGLAAEFAVPLRKAGIQVVDLSADFRLKSAAVFAEFYLQVA